MSHFSNFLRGGRAGPESVSKLRQKLEKGRLEEFKTELKEKSTDIWHRDDGINVFERACIKPRSHEFIQALIEHKQIDVTKPTENLKKYPIQLAIESLNINNIEIISSQNEDINIQYNGETIFHIMFKYITDDNCEELGYCVDYLLEKKYKDLDLNITDNDGKTAVMVLLENKELKDERKRTVLMSVMGEVHSIDYGAADGTQRSLIADLLHELEFFCFTAKSEELQQALKEYKLKPINKPLVADIIRCIFWYPQYEKEYRKCLDILLADNHISEIIHLRDSYCNESALYFANLLQDDELVLKLLNNSAYIGTEFNDGPVLMDMNPRVIEKHLDNCMTSNNYHHTNENYKIYLNYSTIIPPAKTESETSTMEIFQYIGSEPEFEHLLLHPVIKSFLYLKWSPLNLLFEFNISISSIYFLLSIYFFAFTELNSPVDVFTKLRFSLSVFCYIIVFFNSYFNFPIYNLIPILVLFPRYTSIAFEYPVYFLYIMIAGFEFLFCLKGAGFLSISKHFFLFKKVLIAFLQVVILYFFGIIIFAMVFYRDYHEFRLANNIEDSDEQDKIFNRFQKPHLAILKTLLMSVGELDSGDFKYLDNSIFLYLLAIFIISMTIVLSNLLVGLAVADTESIMLNAELNELGHRIQIMAQNESMIKKIESKQYLGFLKPIIQYLSFEHLIPAKAIIIFPNKANVASIRAAQIPNYISKKSTSLLEIARNNYWAKIKYRNSEKLVEETLNKKMDIDWDREEELEKQQLLNNYHELAHTVKNKLLKKLDEIFAENKDTNEEIEQANSDSK